MTFHLMGPPAFLTGTMALGINQCNAPSAWGRKVSTQLENYGPRWCAARRQEPDFVRQARDIPGTQDATEPKRAALSVTTGMANAPPRPRNCESDPPSPHTPEPRWTKAIPAQLRHAGRGASPDRIGILLRTTRSKLL
jgi:hypothetical protein